MQWKIINLQESKIIQTRPRFGKWNFSIHLSSLIPSNSDSRVVKCKAYYMCPASNLGKPYCNYPGHFFCGYWGCETVASDWSPPVPDKNIKVQWGPPGCKPPRHRVDGMIVGDDGTVAGACKATTCERIEITVCNPNDDIWLVGKIWGIRFLGTRSR